MWSCMRANEPSSKRRPMRARKRRKPKGWATTSRGSTRSGLYVCRTRKLPEQSTRGEGRDGEAATHVPGALTRYVLTSSQTLGSPAARRGRPAKADPLPLEAGSRLVVDVGGLANPEEDHGWTVLATTVSAEACPDAGVLQASQEQHTPVEPGLRWLKHPAAIAPVWLEKPERIAALAMLTVLGLLVSSIIQRQVRLYLRTHDQQIPGNTGTTATPTAAVVLALFAQVALVQCWLGDHEVVQVYGVQPHHLLICDALGLDHAWYAMPSAHKIDQFSQSP